MPGRQRHREKRVAACEQQRFRADETVKACDLERKINLVVAEEVTILVEELDDAISQDDICKKHGNKNASTLNRN